MVIGFRLDKQGLIPSRGKILFFTPQHPGQLWGHPASHTMGTGGSFPRVKQLGHEADHAPESSAEIKNGAAIPSLPIHLHGMMLN
jgi:hypothetical protein